MALGRVDHQLEQTIPSLTFKFKKILVVADRLQALKLMVWKSLLQSINLDMRKPAGWLFETQTVFHARQRELEKAIREKHCWGSVTSVSWSRLLWLSSKHHISRDWARACINRRDGTCLGEQGGRRCWLMRRSKRNLSSCLFSQEVPAGECVQMFKQHQKFQKRFGWVRPGTAASLSGLDGGWRQGFREAVESFCSHHAQNAFQCLHGNKKHSALAAYSSRNPSLSVQPQLIFSDWACKSLVVFARNKFADVSLEQTDGEIKSEGEMFYGFKVVITQTGRGGTFLIPRHLYLIWQNCIQGHDCGVEGGWVQDDNSICFQVNIPRVSLAKWLLKEKKTKRQAEIERKTKRMMIVNDPNALWFSEQ